MLDNKNLLPQVIKYLRNMPISERRDLPRDTKVSIYDRNCGRCGFCRVEVSVGDEIKVYHNVEDAIMGICKDYKNRFEISRSCEYPGNLEDTENGIQYPTLTEIIMNTCRFWSASKIEQCDEIAEDLIAKQIEISNGQLSEYRHNGEISSNETVPERECSKEISVGNTTSDISGQETQISLPCDEITLFKQ